MLWMLHSLYKEPVLDIQAPNLMVWIVPCDFKQGFLPSWRLCFHPAKSNSFFSGEEVSLLCPLFF